MVLSAVFDPGFLFPSSFSFTHFWGTAHTPSQLERTSSYSSFMLMNSVCFPAPTTLFCFHIKTKFKHSPSFLPYVSVSIVGATAQSSKLSMLFGLGTKIRRLSACSHWVLLETNCTFQKVLLKRVENGSLVVRLLLHKTS